MPSAHDVRHLRVCAECHKFGDKRAGMIRAYTGGGVAQGPTLHWMHISCYLDTGRSPDEIPIKTLARTPYGVLAERGLLDWALARISEGGR